MKKLKRILKIVFISILTLIIIFNLYSFISIKVLKKELVTLFGYSYLEVISGSMEPTINIGDIIIIDTKDNDYKENDIVTFKDVNGSFVTHKIIKKAEEGFITKGDNNNTIDQDYLKDEDIVGTYKFKLNHLGVIIASFKNPITLLTILIIGVIVCILKNTDKDGMPLDLSDEFKEFLDYKENKTKKVNNKVVEEKNPTIKKTTAKKVAEEKKPVAKKATTKKVVEKKNPTIKKTTAKKVAEEKKPVAKKATAKKVVEEKKPVAKKTTAKKVVEEKNPTIKKTTTKKVVEEKKPVAKKATAKKVAGEKKSSTKKPATNNVKKK